MVNTPYDNHHDIGALKPISHLLRVRNTNSNKARDVTAVYRTVWLVPAVLDPSILIVNDVIQFRDLTINEWDWINYGRNHHKVKLAEESQGAVAALLVITSMDWTDRSEKD